MSENIRRRVRWSAPKLDRHEDFIVRHRSAGASLRELQRLLRKRSVRASVSTISRYLKSLPAAALQDSSPIVSVRSSAGRGSSRTAGQDADRQARNWIRKGLALGQPRHGNQADGKIHSVGTMRNYQGVLTRYCRWLQQNGQQQLSDSTTSTALQYLLDRSKRVGQKTLDLDRQAIQYLHRQITGTAERLDRIKSSRVGGRQLADEPRAYSAAQLDAVCSKMSPRRALAARICYRSGLRAHELATIRPASEQSASTHREWSSKRHAGREGMLYVVAGKGGLRREVLIPADLAAQLEARRRRSERSVRDRGVNYRQLYDVALGKKLSEAWTKASRQALGWSAGLHGLRHSYAQNRMNELQALGYGREERKSIVSQELGHFRTTETETYLR